LIVGQNQLDLVQTIASVLTLYNEKEKAALLSNVVVVGGGSTVPGLKERL
jgi:actin-related protein